MSGKNNDLGCGTTIAILLIIGFISSYWPIILGIVAVVVLIYIIYKKSQNKNSFNKKTYIVKNDKLLKDGTILESGKYVATRDIDKMDGWKFENFCAEVLKKNGYDNVNVTPGSGDQGVDITAERDGIKYAIQCKRFSQPVGNKAVQEIYAGMKFYHCHVGIIITNNYFTKSAKELAGENGIILWDRDFLMKFLKSDDLSKEIDIQSEKVFEIYSETKKHESEDDKIVEISYEEEEKGNMYDSEKGVYPPGMYVAGEDLPLGRYLLKRIDPKGDTMIAFYENYSKYRKQEINQLERFSDDYYVSLRENGMVIAVRNAEIRKL